MKKLRLDELQPGMILAKAIYAADGRILVKEKTPLSESLIRKFQALGLPAAYIDEDSPFSSKEFVSDATRADLIAYLAKLDKEIRSGHDQKILNDKKLLNNLLYEVFVSPKCRDFLSDIRIHNAYIYGHSVNVCALAVKIGMNMNYTANKLQDLAIGALLHDIGMTKIPLEILNKTTPLANDEAKMVANHPVNGYNLLKKNWNVPAVSAHIAFQHHERYNGEGYPRQLTGTAIHEFARITAIADVFDAMTSERVYRPACSVFHALQHLEKERGVAFDPEIVNIFLRIID